MSLRRQPALPAVTLSTTNSRCLCLSAVTLTRCLSRQSCLSSTMRISRVLAIKARLIGCLAGKFLPSSCKSRVSKGSTRWQTRFTFRKDIWAIYILSQATCRAHTASTIVSSRQQAVTSKPNRTALQSQAQSRPCDAILQILLIQTIVSTSRVL